MVLSPSAPPLQTFLPYSPTHSQPFPGSSLTSAPSLHGLSQAVPVCETFLKTSLLHLEVSLSRSQLRIFLMSSSSRPIICILEIRTSFEIVLQNILSFSFLDSLMSSILPFPSPRSILKLLVSISKHFSVFSEAFHSSSPSPRAGGI